jgi:hypothetical protein
MQTQQFQAPAAGAYGWATCLEQFCRRLGSSGGCGCAPPRCQGRRLPLRLEAGGTGDHAAESPLQRLVDL